MPIETDVRGLDELRRNLRKLDENAQGKALRFAVRKAAKAIADQAKDNVRAYDDPRTAEEIAENVQLRYSSKENRRAGNHRFLIGVAGGAKKKGEADQKGPPGGDTWYWRFLEFGVPARGIPAKPFLRKAAAQKEAEVFDIIASEAFKAVTRGLKRK